MTTCLFGSNFYLSIRHVWNKDPILNLIPRMSVKTARLWSILGKVVKFLSEHIILKIKSISDSKSYVLFAKVLSLIKNVLKKPKKCYKTSGLSHPSISHRQRASCRLEILLSYVQEQGKWLLKFHANKGKHSILFVSFWKRNILFALLCSLKNTIPYFLKQQLTVTVGIDRA